MNKVEVKEVLDYLSYNYNTFNVTEGLFKMWLDELQQYDKTDVMEKIKKMIASGNYRISAPQLVSITSGLVKTDKKIDWNRTVTFCKGCNKAFQCDNTGYSKEYDEHRGKCNSINYIIKQRKKWFNKDTTRAELWAMSEQEFNERYNELLHYIHDHTDNETEKTMIEYVFNPPKDNFFM
jgi:hypothetical protein